jgi:hypothetical protein
VLFALPLAGQAKPKDTKAALDDVPVSAYPPAGLCRVWLAHVPEQQQPAPTDCATAIKKRPAMARVLFGDLHDEDGQPKSPATATRPADGSVRPAPFQQQAIPQQRGSSANTVARPNEQAAMRPLKMRGFGSSAAMPPLKSTPKPTGKP